MQPAGLNKKIFKPGQLVRMKRCYFREGEFQTGHQTKLFFEINKDIKSSCNINNLELLYLDKYQT